ncbi:hypothetical protein C500_14530 [Natrialba magadii ATCC 43099]|uniref:Uncharacterized protein n=2 Tax=Natrialba magadii TaxID=13769 RepID=L9UQQ6_NATMM|nr:hypothetical protein C500_14530 [Natrialba magadii ATCC 43099]
MSTLRQFGSGAESLSATALPETGTEIDLPLGEIEVLEALVEAELGERREVRRRRTHSNMSNSDSNTGTDASAILVLIPIAIILVAAAAVPAWIVWSTAPPVGGEFYPYIRLATTMITAIVGAFIGAFILQSAVTIARDLTGGGRE